MKENMKVLFATDFLPPSKNAMNAVIMLKKSYKAKVYLVHVITSFWKDWVSSGLYEKECRNRLEGWQIEVAPTKPNPGRCFVVKGEATEHVLRLAEEQDVDLIMMGSESTQFGMKSIVGSVGVDVVRQGKRSVWLSKSDKVESVLCGVDLSDMSKSALKEAIQVAHKYKAKLAVVTCLPKPSFNPLGMGQNEIDAAEEKFKAECIKMSEKFIKQFNFGDLDVQFKYPWGTPSRTILNIAEDFDYDLIVIGAQGVKASRKILLGSTAEKVLRNTPCSLMVVR